MWTIIILPIAYFSILMVLGNWSTINDWRQAALRAAMFWGSYLIIQTEILSLFNAVTPLALFLGWCLPVLMAGILLWRWRKNGKLITLPKFSRPENWLDTVLLAGLVAYLGITALVAWLAPPNTYDSLNYHMSRVAHWAQNHSIRHFISGIEIQNSQAPGAEIIVLNTYVLAWGDRWVNFVEWFASLGSVIGVAWIAARMGANRIGQRLASIFVVTLPMGISQASSTMTDYVVAFWMICVASEVVNFHKGRDKTSLLFTGLATGMAFLTKATAAVYLIPFGVWMAISAFRHLGLQRSLTWGMAVLGLALLINFGYLARNQITYGHVFDQSMTEAHQNELRTWQGVTSNILRNAALHAGTPWPDVNQWLWVQILKVHVKILKLDMNDPRTTSVGEFHILRAPDYGEVTVGNPVHAVLVIFTFLLSIFLIRKVGKLNLIYALAVSLTLVVFSYLFKWQIFSSRYHLPLFVLFAPSVGCIFSSLILHPRINSVISSLIGMLLLALCSPWLFHIDNRPLIPNTGGVLAGKSLLNDTRQNWYFATLGGGSGMFTPITSAILSTNCHEVGIMISGAGAEYPFWVLLGMPRNDIRIEWSVVDTPNERYRDPSFLPCALICDSCQNFDTFSNLPESVGDGSLLTKVLDNGFQLFIQE